MAKTTKLTNEERERRAARTKTCAKIARKATEAGFKHPGGRGYWTALRAWCEEHGIKYPMLKRGRKTGGQTAARRRR